MRMSTLIETVSKKPIQPWQRSVIVEVMVENEQGSWFFRLYMCSSGYGLC